MKTIDVLGISFGNFRRRKLRSFLTVAGVVIGTASIVVMMSLGIAINESFSASYANMGSVTKINVNPSWNESGQQTGKLDDELVEQLSQLDGVKFVSPTINISGKFVSGRYDGYPSLTGVDLSKAEELGLKFEYGGIDTEAMANANSKTLNVIYGGQAAYQFNKRNNRGGGMYISYGYGYGGDTGEVAGPELDLTDPATRVRYTFDYGYGSDNSGGSERKSPLYTVKTMGVLASDNGDNDYNALIDIEVAKKLKIAQLKYNGATGSALRDINYDSVGVFAESMDEVAGLIEVIQGMGYQAWGIGSMIGELQQQMGMIQALLGAIGAVSLLVAAIGIANTMVMSIYERTREIGIMKVIGCYLKDIQAMFLFEAGFIGLFGGIVGVAISYALSFAMNSLAAGGGGVMIGIGGSKISSIPPWLALLAMGFSILVALVSGFFPSRRAMKLSALEAMRN